VSTQDTSWHCKFLLAERDDLHGRSAVEAYFDLWRRALVWVSFDASTIGEIFQKGGRTMKDNMVKIQKRAHRLVAVCAVVSVFMYVSIGIALVAGSVLVLKFLIP